MKVGCIFMKKHPVDCIVLENSRRSMANNILTLHSSRFHVGTISHLNLNGHNF